MTMTGADTVPTTARGELEAARTRRKVSRTSRTDYVLVVLAALTWAVCTFTQLHT